MAGPLSCAGDGTFHVYMSWVSVLAVSVLLGTKVAGLFSVLW